MQGKGIIRFFLIVMAIVCVFQYLLVLPTNKVEKQANRYAQSVASGFDDPAAAHVAEKTARVRYLDSVSNEKIFSVPLFKSYTYQELKGQQLALGLDLKGGLSTLLQVDLEEFLVAMSQNSKDPSFLEAVKAAKIAQTNSQQDFVTLFGQAWNDIADGKRLASIFGSNNVLQELINIESTDAQVLSALRSKADETVQLTFQRLKDRIDKFGVTQPNVTLDENRDLILVELPGVDNPERARNFLQSQAKLEFWNIYRYTEGNIINKLVDLDEKLKNSKDSASGVVDSIMVAEMDSLGNLTGDSVLQAVNEEEFVAGPLLANLGLNGNGSLGQAPIGIAQGNRRASIDAILQSDDVKKQFKDIKFLWAADPIYDYTNNESTDQYFLYAIKKEPGKGEEALLSGDHVISASAQPDPLTSEVMVSLRMDNQGARIWADMTTKAASEDNKEIAIVLDEEVVSAPSVNQPITGGNSSITGNFSIQDGQDLANILQVGKLPTKTKIIQESLVGPSLGKDNIKKSIASLLIGFGLVLLFMILYYGTSGLMSIVALFANLFFVFGALASFGTVLTLPGIAGIVLTIGMAVDANVIIYERIREELRAGKALKSAIIDGFKHSYSAIIDANITTLLVAFVLAYFGIGPIKGFAVVLIIGVIFSLFTAVLLTRLLIDWWMQKDRDLSFWTPASKNMFANLSVDWMAKKKIGYIVSGSIIVLGLISFVARGFDYGVDFKGGYSYTIQFEPGQNVSNADLKASLADVFEGEPVVKAVDVQNTFNVVTDYLVEDQSDEAAENVMKALHQGVNSLLGGQLDYDNFKLADGSGTHIVSSSKVGPTIADDIKKSSIYATIVALLLIFLYIFIRFSKWQYSLGAVTALFHDTLVVLSVFSIFHGILPFTLEIDQNFIAALLTVIGYSINDTVVLFDRIREFVNTYIKKGKTELFNLAINATVSRTVITSLTTFFVVFILFAFGGGSIRGFAFALMIGVIVGTYSSIFVAAPIVHDLVGDTLKESQGQDKASAVSTKTKTTV